MGHKAGAATAFPRVGADNPYDLAVKFELDLGVGQETSLLADFGRNGHLTFRRDAHWVFLLLHVSKEFGRSAATPFHVAWREETTDQERRQILAALAAAGRRIKIYCGWRPNLADENDNYLIELVLRTFR